MVGAILTQNTAWTNVEKAIANLKQHKMLNARRLLQVSDDCLGTWLRPSGYFNLKTQRLKNFCRWYVDNGGHEVLSCLETSELRGSLLSVNGVGPETADDILLYAFARPVFVIDAYTYRIFTRLGILENKLKYEALRAMFEQSLHRSLSRRNKSGRVSRARLTRIYNEYHALIVLHGKDVCRSRPLCHNCCLSRRCLHVNASV